MIPVYKIVNLYKYVCLIIRILNSLINASEIHKSFVDKKLLNELNFFEKDIDKKEDKDKYEEKV